MTGELRCARGCLLFPKLTNPQRCQSIRIAKMSCLLFPKLINPQHVVCHGEVGMGCLLFPKLINPQHLSTAELEELELSLIP